MSRQIFISYRRDDSSGSAGRLFDRLKLRFGEENIFFDVESISGGSDFIKAIRENVGGCDVASKAGCETA
jgi:hypothetical protein